MLRLRYQVSKKGLKMASSTQNQVVMQDRDMAQVLLNELEENFIAADICEINGKRVNYEADFEAEVQEILKDYMHD